jgi:hypothetical protein
MLTDQSSVMETDLVVDVKPKTTYAFLQSEDRRQKIIPKGTSH